MLEHRERDDQVEGLRLVGQLIDAPAPESRRTAAATQHIVHDTGVGIEIDSVELLDARSQGDLYRARSIAHLQRASVTPLRKQAQPTIDSVQVQSSNERPTIIFDGIAGPVFGKAREHARRQLEQLRSSAHELSPSVARLASYQAMVF